MKRILLLTTLLSTPAMADTFNWIYNDGIDTGAGSFVTVPQSDGTELIVSITGSVNALPIVGLAPTGTVSGNDNLLYPNATYFGAVLDGSGFGFFTAAGNIVDIDLSFIPPPLFYQFDTFGPTGPCLAPFAPCSKGPDAFTLINTTPPSPPIEIPPPEVIPPPPEVIPPIPPIIPPPLPVPAPVAGSLSTLLRLFLPAQWYPSQDPSIYRGQDYDPAMRRARELGESIARDSEMIEQQRQIDENRRELERQREEMKRFRDEMQRTR